MRPVLIGQPWARSFPSATHQKSMRPLWRFMRFSPPALPLHDPWYSEHYMAAANFQRALALLLVHEGG